MIFGYSEEEPYPTITYVLDYEESFLLVKVFSQLEYHTRLKPVGTGIDILRKKAK
jgi:hypothetical protein